MKPQYLLHQDGRWLSFDGRHVRPLDARPRLNRATVVVTDFDGAVSQVTALEGSPAHAVALIEKRLRADGLIDNESKILIHRTRTVGNGYQALFTAVPLDRWQQMFAWAENQPDHCLLVPTVALLWRTLKPGRGVVLHSGRQFVFLAAVGERIVHASALAFSDSHDDLAMTAASLAERVGRELAEGDALQALDVQWVGALTPVPAPRAVRPASAAQDVVLSRWGARARHDDTPTERAAAGAAGAAHPHPVPADDGTTLDGMASDGTPTNGTPTNGMTFDGQAEYVYDALPVETAAVEDAPAAAAVGATHEGWLDEWLMHAFAAGSGATVALAPHVRVTDEAGRVYRSGLPNLAAAAGAQVAVNSGAARGMYLAERLLPWASAASLVLALGLGALSGRWALAAHDARNRADALQTEIDGLNAQIAALEPRQALPESYPAQARFVERAANLEAALDPTAALLAVREAAGRDVRILRLRLDQNTQTQTLRVDGAVNHGADPSGQGMQIARFVQRLRDVGYVPEAIDPQTGNARAQAPGGSFSYRLTRASAAVVPAGASL